MGKVRQGVGLEDVNAHLLALGRRELELEAFQVRMNQEIDAVKADYTPRLEALSRQIKVAKAGLQKEVSTARRTLFEAGVKTIELLFGWVGFREIRGSVKLAKGTLEDEAVELLQKRGLDHLVRKRLAVNREAVQAALSAGELDDDGLRRCGLVFKKPGEKFYHELKRAEIEKQG